MARACVFRFEAQGAAAVPPSKAAWTLSDELLTVLPDGSLPRAYSLREFRGVSGDGYSVHAAMPGGDLVLERLGADGASLLGELRRLWPPERAKALRIDGTGEQVRFACRWDAGGGIANCDVLLYEDVLVVAPEGQDARPLFVSMIESVSFDESAYAVLVKDCEGRVWTFDKLAGKTREFEGAVEHARAVLARESAETLAAHVPALDAGIRGYLAGFWAPGRLLPVQRIEEACPGFRDAFRKSWLAQLPRKREGEAFLSSPSAADHHLGFCRPGVLRQAPAEPDETPENPEGGEDDAAAAPPADGPADVLIYLLARAGDSWLLEALSEPDHATYRFDGGDGLPGLLSNLLSAPQFSVEAIYLPLEALAGERSALSLPARELPFLRELRSRFKGRIIHQGFERWRLSAGL